ncbi:helix-turn-helix transcriptional regulator [Mailhella massiliensis]|uniref:Metalloregulator ArsR/SmtB family transcription factor n=1 Tax=Mailhella massiliensis TaxID=1903261 RepID=A0A921AXW6_9BACT|nr:metalloregulator ArsR/SmtB family transcription factor [Mailhella massiliensis]HJD97783.1 metalloregulator ArsR/SmtB family transcription factor [Mailhella massiliensis]
MDNAPLYRALADETRRRIVVLLLTHNMCVTALARSLNISESAVSQHLRVLKEACLLSGEKRGYHMHYAVERERLHDLAREIEGMANMEREGGAEGLVRLPMAPLPKRGK